MIYNLLLLWVTSCLWLTSYAKSKLRMTKVFSPAIPIPSPPPISFSLLGKIKSRLHLILIMRAVSNSFHQDDPSEESWVLKNWCFWTVVLEKTLESPWDCKEIQPVHPKRDQSWVFIGRTDVDHLMRRADSLEKTLMLGRIGGRRRRGRQRMRWLDGITDSMHMSLGESGSWWWTGRPGVLRFMGSQSRTRLSDWTGTGISLLRFSVPSWFSLGRLWISRNLSFPSTLSYLLVYSCS